jgi:type IV pilus assembly protein PilE
MIELVLAIAILCLLIAVTVASIYDHQSHKDRGRAIHRLQEVAEWLQLQRATQPSYAGVLAADWSASSEGKKYQISLATKPVTASDPQSVFPAVGPDTFTLQAIPVTPDKCGTLLVDQSGRRGVTGAGATVSACWE